MAVRFQIYKCEICGNIVELLHGGKGQLVCCGQPMTLMEENVVDASREKHLPAVETDGATVHVKIGTIPHPMEEKHYIEWIEVIDGNKSHIHFLSPRDNPKASFNVSGESVTTRCYCNIHGLWKR